MPFVFSRFFEWWYYSGTPEVRMRYAHIFLDLMSYIKYDIFIKGCTNEIN